MAKPNKNKPKPQQQQPESNFRWFFGHIFSLIRRHGNIVVMWSGIGWCAHEVSLGAIAFAGKESIGNFSLSVLANLDIVWSLSISLSGISVGLYFKERAKHRETRERLTGRIAELELKIDPARTSSHLTSEGLTRKEDE
jgi:hypothetical protein